MEKDNRVSLEETNNLMKCKLLQRVPRAGRFETAIPRFYLSRRNHPTDSLPCFYKPLVALIIQGYKCSALGAVELRYGENQTMVTSIDVPCVSRILEAAPETPCLGVLLELDSRLILQLLTEMKLPPLRNTPHDATAIADTDPLVLDAFLRLTELLDAPEQQTVMAPLIIREIHYRLLAGPLGNYLRMVNTTGTQSNQIARAVSWLKDNFKESLDVDELAGRVNMAPSSFYRHFSKLTSVSPLQYQKRLRLYEAQRLMLVEKLNATDAGYSVGYESPTQFNREYKRLFGNPPRSDIRKIQYN